MSRCSLVGVTDQEIMHLRRAWEKDYEDWRNSYPDETNVITLVGQLGDLVYDVALALRRDRHPDKDNPPQLAI